MISAYQNLDAPHPHALQRFRPTTVPIKPRTSTESPPMFFTKSVKIVVVVTIFNFPESCEKSSQETRTTHNRRNKRSPRSEERRVGKESKTEFGSYHHKQRESQKEIS